MKLQKLQHSIDDIEGGGIITHAVNEFNQGGEFTVCGRAIPDSTLEDNGWQAFGEEFFGRMYQCDCMSCRRIIQYYKSLK